jgi:hypothetical protein
MPCESLADRLAAVSRPQGIHIGVTSLQRGVILQIISSGVILKVA